jgi:hypothetical protein
MMLAGLGSAFAGVNVRQYPFTFQNPSFAQAHRDYFLDFTTRTRAMKQNL